MEAHKQAQAKYEQEMCPFCGYTFYPGDIDDHVINCESVIIQYVGTMADVADLEKSDGIKCKF